MFIKAGLLVLRNHSPSTKRDPDPNVRMLGEGAGKGLWFARTYSCDGYDSDRASDTSDALVIVMRLGSFGCVGRVVAVALCDEDDGAADDTTV